MVTFGGLAAITALPASATVTTNSYTIGAPTGAVSNVAISPTSTVAGTATSFTLTFVSPAALSNSSGDSITVADNDGNAIVDTAVTTTVDVISGSCIQAGDTTYTAPGPMVIDISSACGSIAAGATVEVTFTATTPASSTTSYYFEVSTSENATTTDSPTVSNTARPPTLAVNSSEEGADVVYTIDDAGASNANPGSWSTLTASSTFLELDSTGAAGPPTTWITWDTSGTADYSVTYTPSGGTAAADTVEAVLPGATANIVYLELGTAIASGGTVNLTGEGTNPETAFAPDVTITPGTCTVAGVTCTSANVTANFTAEGTAETTATITIGTSVTSPTLSVSPLVGGDEATYVVGFKATDAVASTGSITIQETTGPSDFATVTGVLVTDSTAGWHFVYSTPGPANGSAYTIPIATGGAIAAGDQITLTAVNVTNPANQTITDFDVYDSTDTVPVAVASYTLSAAGTAAPTVVPSPATTGAVATYTVTGVYATAAITAASTAYELVLTAPAGTVLPDVGGDYLLTDTTTPSGSGTFTLESYNSATSVTLEFPNAVNSGDKLVITVEDIINPSTSGNAYSITLTGDVAGQTGIAPFPNAATSYPNGALVDFSGTYYLFAGGHPFGIATPTILSKLRSVDKATPLSAVAGTLLPTTAPRAGTLITTNTVNGNATIYVVGTDGELHGFATGAQYAGDGYDPALAVTVPNLGGLTTGATAGAEGSSATALATSADGAIVDSSGTYFVFDGGRAFGIPSPAALTAVRKNDTATAISGSVGVAQTGASFASGALITVNGEVYVGYVGDVFPFKTMSQFDADGYGGTASITSWNLGGLPVVSTYSGS